MVSFVRISEKWGFHFKDVQNPDKSDFQTLAVVKWLNLPIKYSEFMISGQVQYSDTPKLKILLV